MSALISLAKNLALFLIAVFVFYILFLVSDIYQNYNSQKNLKSPGSIPGSTSGVLGEKEEIENSKKLEEVVQKALEGTKGTYSVSIKNLKSGEAYNFREDEYYDAGSLYKLWVMSEVFKNIQDGTLKEDEVLSKDIATLNQKFSINPELAEQKEGAITLSVKSALNQMITISHNYASLLLTEKIRLSKVANFLKDNGFNESKVGDTKDAPKTTSADTALFFEKLYKGEIGTPENTTKMLDLLKAQKLNDKIPKLLPQGTVIAHKTGEIEYFTHDAGIVYTNNGEYIIVVLSQSNMPSAAEDRIAEISKAVYDYFTK